MKIPRRQLRSIIKEELSRLNEKKQSVPEVFLDANQFLRKDISSDPSKAFLPQSQPLSQQPSRNNTGPRLEEYTLQLFGQQAKANSEL